MIRFCSFFLAIVVLFSCSTSNDVVSNKLFQKRKYQKGWHKNSSRQIASKSKKSKKRFSFNKSNEKDSVVKSESTIADKTIESSANFKEEIKKTVNQEKELKTVSTKSKGTKNIEIETSIDKLREDAKEFKFKSLEEPETKKKVQSPPLDRDDSDTRILLLILGIAVLVFTGISPLAVWIALGRGEALRINWIIFILSLIFMVMLFVALLTFIFSASEFVIVILGVLTIIGFLASFIHALVSIIRGY